MKKKLFRSSMILLFMLPAIAFAHFMVFPEETRCILIPFSGFEKKENIYFSRGTPPGPIAILQLQVAWAEKKLERFWGGNAALNYTIIYCNTEKDFNRYGIPGAPAVTRRKLGAYAIFHKESLDSALIAHELSHAVLYDHLGWYKCTFTIPTWFDEGLAMQVDDRDHYSIDSLLQKKREGIKLPDVTTMNTAAAFHSGSKAEIMLNYATAKYVVHEWLTTHSLDKFIDRLKNGRGFYSAWNEKD